MNNYEINLAKGYEALKEAKDKTKNYLDSYAAYLEAAVHFSEAGCAVGLLAIVLNSQHCLPSVMETINNLTQ